MTDELFVRLKTGWEAHERTKAETAEEERDKADRQRRQGEAAGRAWAESTIDFALLERAYQNRVFDPRAGTATRSWIVSKATGRPESTIKAEYVDGFLTGVAGVMDAFFERMKAEK